MILEYLCVGNSSVFREHLSTAKVRMLLSFIFKLKSNWSDPNKTDCCSSSRIHCQTLSLCLCGCGCGCVCVCVCGNLGTYWDAKLHYLWINPSYIAALPEYVCACIIDCLGLIKPKLQPIIFIAWYKTVPQYLLWFEAVCVFAGMLSTMNNVDQTWKLW